MEIKGGQAQAFVAGFARKPDPKLRVALVYGNDEGLVAERGRMLAQAVCADLTDAFQVVELAGAAVEDDPARLLDEFQSISMLGGRRVVRLRPAGDGVADAVSAVLEASAGDALVVVEAGSLPQKGSALRRLVEASPFGAAIPCFADADETIGRLVESALGELGLRAEPDAREYLVDNLGGDRGVSRSELEKLALYKGVPSATAPAEARAVTLADAMAVIGDTAGIHIDDAVYAAFSGDPGALDRALDRVFAEGVAPVAAVRALQRHADTLHRLGGLVESGGRVEDAVARLRPAPHFLRKPALMAQLRFWSPRSAAAVLDLIMDAEVDCKTTGSPDEVVARRAAMRIATGARSIRARARAR